MAASKSAASFTGRPSRPERWAATGARENFSSTTPSVGRPRCESRTTPAPLSSAMRMPGRAARIRLSLVMRPSFMGTLRSWRMTTVLPLHSMSCNSLMGMSASFLSGKGSPGRAGTRRPVCQKDMFPEEESPARPQRSKRMPLAEYPATAVPPPDGRTAWCDVLRRISVCSECRARQGIRTGIPLGYGKPGHVRPALGGRDMAAARFVHARQHGICPLWAGRKKARDLGICHPAIPGLGFTRLGRGP